jgi:hypothetical protein
MPRLDRCFPGKEPVLVVKEAWWAPGPVWNGAENPTPVEVGDPKCSSP